MDKTKTARMQRSCKDYGNEVSLGVERESRLRLRDERVDGAIERPGVRAKCLSTKKQEDEFIDCGVHALFSTEVFYSRFFCFVTRCVLPLIRHSLAV